MLTTSPLAANHPCLVYDCVLHPDTYLMGRNNAAFDRMLIDTAIEGIEKRFDVKLDRSEFLVR